MSLFGGGYILHNRETLPIGGSIPAMLRVTSLLRGVTHYTTWQRAVYRTMGRVLHTVSADGCEKRARRAQQRVTSLLGGFTYCTTVKRYLFDRNECAPFIILL